MKQNFSVTFCSLVIGAALCAPPLIAYQNDQSTAPDNTRVNKQDRNQPEATADRAKNDLTDRQTMARIRRDVLQDKSLSTYGHNVKIVADHGRVTLKGPVRSEEEKHAIEEHARKYAPDGNIDNQLTIKEERK